jgi:hypothetical protein
MKSITAEIDLHSPIDDPTKASDSMASGWSQHRTLRQLSIIFESRTELDWSLSELKSRLIKASKYCKAKPKVADLILPKLQKS